MSPNACARPAKWLVAPDSFKGTFAAPSVAAAIAHGLRSAGCETDVCPVADGGEGTLRILVDACRGSIRHASARDPLGRTIEAEFALLADGRTAVVETAEASGLGRVSPGERDAEAASSAGTGDLILAAALAGATRILVAVGGSACTDGGLGAIDVIREGGGLDGVELEILCDSRTAFEAAALVFAAQKGADSDAILRLTARLERLATTFPRDPRGKQWTGCAGGLSGGLWACFGARLRSGAEAVLDAVDFDARVARVDSVVTGEGRLDHQSAEGKLISVVASRASGVGAVTHAVVGQTQLDGPALIRLGVRGAVIEARSLEDLQAAGARLGGAKAEDAGNGTVRSFV